MNPRLCIALALLALAGCASNKTQHSPSLTTPAAAPAPQHDILKEAGDTTWQVVTAPARLVAPKKSEPKTPETFEAPSAMIMQRSYVDEDTPATAPQKDKP